jgi:hypothetical protein
MGESGWNGLRPILVTASLWGNFCLEDTEQRCRKRLCGAGPGSSFRMKALEVQVCSVD